MAAAYTVTENGGEIIALDAADYGPITITKQLSIFGAHDAIIAVATGSAGVTINAPAGDRVIIRDFVISGAGATNTQGIQLNSGQLALLNSTLKQLSIGLNVSNTKADVVNTDVIANGTGINTTGTGVDTNVFPLKGPTQVRIAWGNARPRLRDEQSRHRLSRQQDYDLRISDQQYRRRLLDQHDRQHDPSFRHRSFLRREQLSEPRIL